MKVILVYTTLKNKQEATGMARTLLEEKLIACANILPPHEAIYHWDEAMQREDEVVLLMKSAETVQEALMARIAELHHYDCPCILALPVEAAYPPFAAWIFSQIGD